MGRQPVHVVCAEGEEPLAEQLAGPLREAGYSVTHQGTIGVGESLVGTATKALASGSPIVLCATTRAVGSAWAHQIVNAGHSEGVHRVFVVQMERQAYVEQLAIQTKVARYCDDPATGLRELRDALAKHFPPVPVELALESPHRATDQGQYLDRRTDLATFDVEALQRFRGEVRREVAARYPAALSPWEFLERAGLWDGSGLTRTGALMFGKVPLSVCSTAMVKCVRYFGQDRAAQREIETFEATVPEQIVAAREFVARHVRRGERPSSDQAEAVVVYDYPMIAVREIIANALVHRDYSVADSCVHVRLFEDRLEISSPGAWLGQDLLTGAERDLAELDGQSKKRNFRLAHVLSWIRLVEGEGSGIPSALRDCRNAGSPAPTVRQEQAFITVTIRRCPAEDVTVSNGVDGLVPATLPAVPHGFIGRQHEIAELDWLLSERGSSSRLAVITGVGGVGKSALALSWAHRVKSEFPGGQLYLSLHGFDSDRGRLSAGEALTQLLRMLGVAAEAIPVELDGRAALYRSLLAKRRVLVLLDDALAPEQVRPLLPGSSESLVLVTTRRRMGGLMVQHGAQMMVLDPLHIEAAIELLYRMGVSGEPAAVAELAELCAGLPLALRIAAARLAARPACKVSDLVHELKDEQNRLQALDIGDTHTSVRQVLDTSVRSLHPAHSETFRVLGLVPGHTFTAYAVAALCDADQREAQRRLDALVAASLVAESAPGRYSMHDLARLYARDLVTPLRQPDTDALRRLLTHYLVTADHARRFLRPTRDELNFADGAEVARPEISDRAQALDWFDAEWPNLVAAVRAAKARGMHDLAWQLARLQFNYLMARVPSWEDWIRVYTDGLDSARAADDPTGEVLMSAGLGVAHSRSGQLDEALAHYDESYRVAVANDDASRRAMTQINMASVLFRLKRYDEAKVHCQDALRVYRSLGDSYFEAGALNNLAMVEQVDGELEEALMHLREAEALYRAADDLDTLAMVLNNCGEVCIELGRFDDGERCHHDALDVALKCGSVVRQAAAYLGLGDAAGSRGDQDTARTHWETALAIFESEGSPRATEIRRRLELIATQPSATDGSAGQRAK
ncbi:tetratricopeptide repeat protein [Saccharopolyspora sp. NPDC002376]